MRVTAALLIALIAFAALLIANQGAGTYTLHAYFDSVNGLVDTGNVEVAGFKVGEITGISVKLGSYPEVTMQIDNGFRVRQGARAVVELGSLAGQLNRYVALSGGTGPQLPGGATIPERNTSVPVEIDQFLSTLTPKVRVELRSLLRDVVHTLNGRGNDIHQALRYSAQAFGQTSALLGDVAAEGTALRALVTRASEGASQLASEPAAVTQTVARLSLLLNAAATRQQSLAITLARFPGALKSTRTALSTLDAAVPTFTTAVNAAPAALSAADPFAIALRTDVPRAVPLFASALKLVSAFRSSGPEITRLFGVPLPNTLTNLAAGLHGLNPMLDQIRARAPDALGWLPLLGDASADYNVNGHGVLLLAYMRPAPQQAIAPSSCAAGQLARPFDRVPGALACEPWTDYFKSFVGGGKTYP
ncbi:MAG: MlaD family protein [Solirubrobacteraceae bacterium]